MSSEQQQKQPPRLKPGEFLDILYFVCSVHAATITPFLRYGSGKNNPGAYGLFAMALIYIMAAGYDPDVFLTYLMVWVAMQSLRRVQILWLIPRKGILTHTQYRGYPWLAMRLPFVKKEETALGIVEPLICVVVGAFLCPVSETLGLFVMAGFISLETLYAIDCQMVESRVQRMVDAQIEAEYYAEQYRKKRGD